MAFLYVSILLINIFAFFMPKRISKVEIYGSILFAAFSNILADVYLDLKYQLYSYFNKGVDWKYLIVCFGVFPGVNTIIANYFPYKGSMIKRILHIIGWSLFAVAYEYISLKAGFYHYMKWSLWKSAVSYPFIITILMLNQYLIRRLQRLDR